MPGLRVSVAALAHRREVPRMTAWIILALLVGFLAGRSFSVWSMRWALRSPHRRAVELRRQLRERLDRP